MLAHRVAHAPQVEYLAESIGTAAIKTMNESPEGTVMGVISPGVFIRAAAGRIVFLSFDTHPGPLTINLPSAPQRLRAIRAGTPVTFSDYSLILSRAEVTVSVGTGAVWRPLPRPKSCRSRAERRRLLQAVVPRLPLASIDPEIAKIVMVLSDAPTGAHRSLGNKRGDAKRGGHPPYPPAYRQFLGTEPGQTEVQAHTDGPLLAAACQLRQALAERNLAHVLQTAAHLIGRGPGLTPAGDDLVLGLLLAVNRCWESPWLDPALPDLNRRVVRLAYRQTTTLSANLIECAAAGQADARLIHALDWLLAGDPRQIEPVSHMLSWGASSGAAVLAGLMLALT